MAINALYRCIEAPMADHGGTFHLQTITQRALGTAMLRLLCLFILVAAAVPASEVPLPDVTMLDKEAIQPSSDESVADPVRHEAREKYGITGGGYSNIMARIARLDWAYPMARYSPASIEKAVQQAYHPVLVYEGVSDGITSKTWYVKELKIWVRLFHYEKGPFAKSLYLEYASPNWTAAIAKKFAELYPLPR
jgi:hypothetical protein